MKFAFGVVFAIAGLLILAIGGRRTRVALIIGLVILAFGGWLLFGAYKSWRVQKVAAAFIAAAERGDIATVRRMADDDPLFVNATQSVGYTVKWPLTAAAKELHADVVELLLSRGAIVDAQTGDGSTALHEAGRTNAYGDDKISVKRLATIKALLAHGAKVDAKDDHQETPLMANAHDAKAVALLIDHHADVKARDSSGRTALHYAVGSHRDHSDSVTLLLDHGVEVDARDRDGQTAFLLSGNARELETLVARGADPKVVDSSGQTALHHAARTPNNLFSDLDVMAVLCASGLRFDTPDHAGATPLSLARTELAHETSGGWMKGRQRIVKFLSPGGPCSTLAGASKEQREFVVAEMKCAEDDRGGCASLAWDYDTGKGTAIDKKRAAELYDKACGLGSLAACTNLAYDYDHGEGVTEDLARAVALYERTCDAGGMRACLNLGLLASRGRGTAKDPARAAALFRRACDAGESDACAHVSR